MFEQIETLTAGSTSKSGLYTFTDLHPLDGLNFYRLKMTDRDGSVSYSSVLKINFEPPLFSCKLYPNPATSFINLSLNLKSEEKVFLEIKDLTGRTVLKSDMQGKSGISISTLDIKNLPAGTYRLRARIQNKIHVISFVKKGN